ncbi:MAG: pyridoxamine 5'-phosphate oxidase family protein [Actinobacteria bacterium]|nr:pyridoxamine 5'-phosphate oxidase family protein [Actinomycetota bacterium]
MIHVLSEQRCYDLLTATTVGRAGYVREGVVEIIPMNYAVSGHDLLLRTGSDGALSVLADAGATVSFEVDHLDSLGRAAWSVLMSGPLSRPAPEEAAALVARVSPWPGGERDVPLRFRITRMTGRAVKHESR